MLSVQVAWIHNEQTGAKYLLFSMGLCVCVCVCVAMCGGVCVRVCI